jgi:hypothetical protein
MNPTQHAPPTTPGRIAVALWVICLAGLALRGGLAERLYPMTGGDPLYSYTYRATLIAGGQWDGVYLMWHPPGYPLLVAGLAVALGGIVPVYWVGVGVSLVCYLGLFWVIDRLVAQRARYPGTRLVAGSFVAFYETLFLWAAAPLSEPVYLFALYSAVLVLDRQRPGPGTALAAGLLLGAAFTVRLEAAAPTVGLGLYLVLRGRSSSTGGDRGGALVLVSALVVGWLAAAGWLIVRVDYLRACSAEQAVSYTVPPAHGGAEVVTRVVECAYHAFTVWLPFALLLPYWVLVGAGFTHRASAPGRPSLHLLLLAVVLPSAVAVAWTIMHKRTASFLLPAAALWVALGVEALARQWLRFSPRAVRVVLALVVLGNVIQGVRIGFALRKLEPARDVPDYVAARVLEGAGAEPGPVWAFGSEPDVYALRQWPIVYPFFDRNREYNRAYLDHAGDPAGFVAELRARGFRYLVFVLAPVPAPGSRTEQQPFSNYGPPPDRADLEQIAAAPARFGLEDLGSPPAAGARVRVRVYRVRGSR